MLVSHQWYGGLPRAPGSLAHMQSSHVSHGFPAHMHFLHSQSSVSMDVTTTDVRSPNGMVGEVSILNSGRSNVGWSSASGQWIGHNLLNVTFSYTDEFDLMPYTSYIVASVGHEGLPPSQIQHRNYSTPSHTRLCLAQSSRGTSLRGCVATSTPTQRRPPRASR